MKEQLYKIGEAARMLELETYVLRFWETEFPQLEPLRTPKGQRLYSADHVALLHEVKHLLYEEGLTIEGARKVLERRERGEEAPPIPPPPLPGKSGQPRTHLVQGSLIPGFPPPPKLSDRQLLHHMRAELTALRETLRALAPEHPEPPHHAAPRAVTPPDAPLPPENFGDIQ